MAKPIFLVSVPSHLWPDLNKIENYLENKFYDYHVLCISNDNEKIEFKVFFEKDFDEVKFDELKNVVTRSIAMGRLNK
jgi:hypothetical protein